VSVPLLSIRAKTNLLVAFFDRFCHHERPKPERLSGGT
jgi:hypothetical protein